MIYFVEGISGIGKSNLAQEIFLGLSKIGRPARWFFAMDGDNPLVPERHDAKIVASVEQKLRAYLATYDGKTDHIFDERVFLVNIEKSLLNGISPMKIRELYVPLIKLLDSDKVRFVLLLADHVDEICINTSEVRQADAWYAGNISAYFGIPAENVSAAHISDYYTEVQNIMVELYTQLRCPKYSVRIQHRDWQTALHLAMTSMSLPVSSDDGETETGLGAYPGLFKSERGEFEIAEGPRGLAAVSHPYLRFQPVEKVLNLKRIDPDTFVCRGHPIKLRFERDAAGKVTSLSESPLRADNTETVKNEVYRKV